MKLDYKILQGDVRQRLRELPEKSVHTVVTSPPYWGMREYGTEPQIWGEPEEGHAHEWGEEIIVTGPAQKPGATTQRPGRSSLDQQQQRGRSQGRFCVHEWGEAIRTPWANEVAGPHGRDKNPGASRKVKFTGPMCDKGCGAWLGSLGLEPTPEMYVDHLVQVFREIWQVLRDDGTVWLNLGDTYAGGGNNAGNTRSIAHTKTATNRGNRYVKKPVPEGMKGGDLVGIPWMVAFALRADGWYLRRDIIWWKRNGLPESARTRPSGAHEYFFLLTKTRKPFYDNEAVKVPAVTEGYTRQLRSVWDFPTQSFKGTHYATFNPRLIEPCVLAGTSEKGCCPECGAPWIRVVTKQNARLTDRQNNNAFKHDAATSHGEGATTLRVSADSTTVGWQPGCEHTEEYGGKSREQDPHANSRRIVARAKEARDAGGHHDNPFLPTETVGWEQGCAHPLEPVPCTVLDPFGGAGTTLLTALALRRNAITTELSPKYAAMIRSRVTEREYLKIRRKLSQHRENRAKEHCSTCSCYVPDEILATGEEL